jgi:HD-GYP domain-containing protein (c-di-GMP phosphodiesterase class II)
MRKVPLNLITPDMKLGKSIYNENFLLLRQGTTNLQRYVNKLMELDIGSIYVDDSLSDDIEVHDAISDETRQKCKEALADTFENLLENNKIEISKINDVVTKMMDEIMSQPNVIVSLQDIGSSKDETLLHSVNTTVYGLVLANRMGISAISQRDLAQGLLLHDIGKMLLDQEILYKSSALTREEFEHIKQHTALGYEILKKDPLLTEVSRRVALEHHERLDGSGYSHTKGCEISTLGRIAAVVDVYEALTVDRCYRKGFTPSKAADILIKAAVSELDADLCANFFQCIAIYPNGAMLKLSNGKLAIVKEQNVGVPFRPVIRTIVKKDGRHAPGDVIDLSKTLNVTVIEDDPEVLAELMK